MSFKRQIFPRKFKSGKELDNALNAIGMNISRSEIINDPNIEDTLVSASIEAVNGKNGRIAGLLVDWISLHYERINVDRLTKVVGQLDSIEYKFVIVFWCANAQRLSHDPRFKKLASFYSRKRVDYLDRFKEKGDYKSTTFQIERHGEDKRFKGTCLRLPSKVFAERPNQILPASVIARNHMGFRFRVMLGPAYRADMWGLLRRNPDYSPAELARRAYGSYPTAHQTKRDYLVVKRDYSVRT